MPVVIFSAVVALFLLLPVLDWLVERHLTRSRWRDRSAFVAHRTPQPDDSFLADAKASPEDAELALVARKALAYLCSAPPEMIHSGDDAQELTLFLGKEHFDGLEDLDLQRQIERKLGLSNNELLFLPSLLGRLRILNWRFGGASCVGTWAVQVARKIREKSQNLSRSPTAGSNEGRERRRP